MKKFLSALLVLLLLVGCAVEDSPENYFMMALTEIEESSSYQTQVILKEGNTKLLEIEYEKVDANNEHTTIVFQEKEIEGIETIQIPLCTLQYSMIFSNFTKEDDVVTCDILPENSDVLCMLIANFTSEPLETITQNVYLDDYSMNHVVLELKTKTHTYECTILVK